MATHVIVIDQQKCIGNGVCVASCKAVGNNPPRISLDKKGPIDTESGPRIEFSHFSTGACVESNECMELFEKKGIVPCVENCPSRAINLVEIEELSDFLKENKSGDGFFIHTFK